MVILLVEWIEVFRVIMNGIGLPRTRSGSHDCITKSSFYIIHKSVEHSGLYLLSHWGIITLIARCIVLSLRDNCDGWFVYGRGEAENGAGWPSRRSASRAEAHYLAHHVTVLPPETAAITCRFVIPLAAAAARFHGICVAR